VFFFGLIFLLLLASGVSIIRQPSFLSLVGFSSPPQKQESEADEEDSTQVDFLTVAALSSEETDVRKFRSGGLGLTRTSWEVLHGKPEAVGPVTVVYQEKTYTVMYQQDLVWQIEKSWGTMSPTSREARTRIRRYLPLDSHLAQTLTKSDDTLVDVYRSHMLAQLLSPQPATPPSKKKVKRKRKDLPTESCVVVHRLDKQKVTSTLLHIGAPKPEGYFPPRSQAVPEKTTVSKEPARSDPRKTVSPNSKGRTQGRS
jgi:hypothetical protein